VGEDTELTEPVLVTTRRDLALTSVQGDVEYVGQDFNLRSSWNPLEIGCTWAWPPRCHAAVRWLLFRHTPSLPLVDQWAVLWLRQDVAQGD